LVAKKIIEEIKKSGIEVEEFDVETVDGMAEAALYMVMSTPTTILVNSGEEEIISWRGKIPDKNKIFELWQVSA